MVCSTSLTKTLPSPILPVLAAWVMISTARDASLIGQDDFQFYLRQEIDRVFASAINLGVTFLPTEAFHFTHGHAFDADLGERLLHRLHLEGLDDRFDFFHAGKLEPVI